MSRGHAAILGGLFLVLANYPYLLAYARADDTHVFGGLLSNRMDNAGVLSHMAESARGGLLYQNPYAAPGSPEVYFNPLYFLAGRALWLLHASPLAIFHVVRVLASIAIVLLSVRLARAHLERGAALAVTLALFSSSMDPPVALAYRFASLPSAFAALSGDIPEATTLPTCLGFAHLPVALALLMATHKCGIAALCKGSLRAGVTAAGLLLLLSFTHPFDLVGVVATVGAWLLIHALRGTLARRTVSIAAPVLLASLPSVAYYSWLARAHTDLANRTHFVQAAGFPASSVALVGFTAVAAMLSLLARPPALATPRLYLAVWLCTQLACSMARPFVPFDRRLLMGCLIPSAMLAGPWIAEIWARRGAWRALAILLVLLCVGGTPAGLAGVQARLVARTVPEFLPREDAAIRRDIASRLGPDDLLLCAPAIGVDIPWTSRAKPFVGYKPLTPDFARRLDLFQMFFMPGTGEGARRYILKRDGITHVAEIPLASDVPLRGADYLETMVDLPQGRLYRVRRELLRIGRWTGAGAAPGDRARRAVRTRVSAKPFSGTASP